VARRVVWAYPARADLRAALEYLAEESHQSASKLFEEVEAAGVSLEEFPERGRIVPELKLQDRREIFVQKYRLVYRLERDQITILRLIHGRRDFKAAWKKMHE
jgi:plasmid stabilization system protein ParE